MLKLYISKSGINKNVTEISDIYLFICDIIFTTIITVIFNLSLLKLNPNII